MSHTMTQKINHFAMQSYRNTADKDYIHARMAYKASLFPQFFWSSLHALEKYSKCIALLMRIPNTKARHEIKKTLSLICDKMHIVLSEQTLNFIDNLEDFGARFRYLEVSWCIYKCELAELDRAVWELRRYCNTALYNYDIDEYVEINNEIYKAIIDIEKPTAQNTVLSRGYLEKVLEDKRYPSRTYLVWCNLYYTKSSRKRVAIRKFETFENSPLYLYPEIIDEVSKFVFLPNEIKSAYKAG